MTVNKKSKYYKLLKINGDNVILIGQSLFKVTIMPEVSYLPCDACTFNVYVDSSFNLCDRNEACDEVCTAELIDDKLLCHLVRLDLNRMVYFEELNKPYNLFLSSFLRNSHLRDSYISFEDDLVRSILPPEVPVKYSRSTVISKISKWIYDKARN